MKLSTKERKKFRVRNKLKRFSKADRFRLSVFRSTKNISAQIIDDKVNKTLVSASSTEKEIKKNKKNKADTSNLVGQVLAKRAIEKKISKVYFDRGDRKYHGRVKTFAESLRKNGLEF